MTDEKPLTATEIKRRIEEYKFSGEAVEGLRRVQERVLGVVLERVREMLGRGDGNG